MQHDEKSLVREAHATARTQVETTGHVLPAAYLLTKTNPQTGAELTFPTALASVSETAIATQKELDEFVGSIREEARRLKALAVVFCAEAQVQLDESGRDVRRVAMLRVEDRDGLQMMHAEIVPGETGHSLGPLMNTNLEAPPDDARWLAS